MPKSKTIIINKDVEDLRQIPTVGSQDPSKALALSQDGSLDVSTLLKVAVTNTASVDVIERLLAVRRELKAEKAKESYGLAMAAFQAECPVIEKRKEVKNNQGKVMYKFAPLESIVEQVKELLKKHGFSYSSNMLLTESGVKAVVKTTHTGGHSEYSEMEVPLGSQTAVMSKSQVVAGAQTFAKRYAFCNAFGILMQDEDNDAVREERPACPIDHETLPFQEGNNGKRFRKCPKCYNFQWIE